MVKLLLICIFNLFLIVNSLHLFSKTIKDIPNIVIPIKNPLQNSLISVHHGSSNQGQHYGSNGNRYHEEDGLVSNANRVVDNNRNNNLNHDERTTEKLIDKEFVLKSTTTIRSTHHQSHVDNIDNIQDQLFNLGEEIGNSDLPETTTREGDTRSIFKVPNKCAEGQELVGKKCRSPA